jgi:hypothetical protein
MRPLPAFLRRVRPWLACAFVGAACAAAAAEPAAPGVVAAPAQERLQVAEPFLELHTGPGRGYPVFFVVERRQWVAVELRRTDWYRVRAEGGQVGWVPRRALQATLTEAGTGKTLGDTLLDDYLGRRLDLGAAAGRFASEPMLKLWLHYRLADAVGAELGVGQVQGRFSSSDFWHLSLSSEPWSDRRLSPFFAVGLGQFRNAPNSSLVGALGTDAKLAHATLGLRWHLAERFVARLDWSLYTALVADERSLEYRATTAGIAFFF